MDSMRERDTRKAGLERSSTGTPKEKQREGKTDRQTDREPDSHTHTQAERRTER